MGVVMNEPIDVDEAVERSSAADVNQLANSLKFRLSPRAPAKIEADLYRGPAPLNAISYALRGHDDFTPEAARRFVADVIDAASADLENQWFTALQGAGAI